MRNSSSSSSFSFFCWWVDVAAFAGLAQAVALDRLGQDDGRLALGFDGRLVGRVDLLRIVAAAAQLRQLLVGQVRDQLCQLGILAEEVLADVGAGHDGVFLELAVDDLAHALDEQAVLVLGQQRVPVVAPDDLDARSSRRRGRSPSSS